MKMAVGKKPSRAEAYALVLDMKTGRRPLEDYDVDALLRFFAPALPKRAKIAEQWVAKAAADQYELRKPLQYIRVENGIAYASNGHRAHRCKTTWADGYYDPKTFLPVDSDERPIDIKRVFPDRRHCEEFTIEALEYGALPCKEKDARPLEYVRVPKSVAVARGYFEEAVNGAETGPVFYASAPAHAQKMVGDTEFGDWVIMAMRVD
ncbi:MAG: hypothetical protein CMH18_07785 [Methylophaga sp.]|uniref:hypothetical protein n=1 Tax=Methylophaga sp. TaxID=2024840 RepID=UPI000C9183C5|nr:hypothetical protein [Methylophaga sp.]MAL49644.1 hypothetical protein [Methylophaga sp.]|tara:strand:- start:1147 stop:1767 length:621 start_codon:yes stop_codon:yes gene_type:complete